MTRIKICGITSVDDARAAVAAGADAIGLVFAESPRRVSVLDARAIIASLAPFVTVVGVFMDQEADDVLKLARGAGLRTIQVHDSAPTDVSERLSLAGFRVIQRVHIDDLGVGPYAARYVSALLADPGAGDGRASGWEQAARHPWPKPLILAGGLSPENVARAVHLVRPYAVDVSSGVESAPGIKDPARVRAFIEAVAAVEAG